MCNRETKLILIPAWLVVKLDKCTIASTEQSNRELFLCVSKSQYYVDVRFQEAKKKILTNVKTDNQLKFVFQIQAVSICVPVSLYLTSPPFTHK